MLFFQGFFTLACVVAYITMLVLSDKRQEECGKPLRTYVALVIVKIAVSYPISFYNALAPPSRPRRGEADTPEARERREARRVVGSPVLDARLRLLADFIALFSLIWFLLGNIWVYSGTECKDTSPYLWWTSLVTLLVAYIRLAEVVLIVVAVVFFLPVVILGLRMFGGLEKKHEIGPLSKDQIASLPLVLYAPAKEDASPTVAAEGVAQQEGSSAPEKASTTHVKGSATPASASNDPTPPPTSRRRTQWLRLLFKRNRRGANGDDTNSSAAKGEDGEYVKTPHTIHPLPDNLSSCPICLSDYEAPPTRSEARDLSREDLKKKVDELELLNLLPCGHTLHKDCLGPWLQTSGRCPICQKAVFPEEEGGKGKKRRRRTITASTGGDAGAQPANAGASPV